MARRTWFFATVLALALPSSPLAPLWDALTALVLDAPMQAAEEAPSPDNSAEDSDRSAALDPLG